MKRIRKRNLFLRIILLIVILSVLTPFSQAQNRARISFNPGIALMGCDLNNDLIIGHKAAPFGQFQGVYYSSNIGVLFFAGTGSMFAKDNALKEASNKFSMYGLGIEYRFQDRAKVSPYAFLKFGQMYLSKVTYLNRGVDMTDPAANNKSSFLIYGPGVGVEFITTSLSYTLQFEILLTNSDLLDGLIAGDSFDGAAFLSFGIGYHW